MKKGPLYFLMLTLLILKNISLIAMDNIIDNNDSTEVVSEHEAESTKQILKNPLLEIYPHTYGSFATQGNYRETMEDFYINHEDCGFHGIYDGHGGDIFGVLAQRHLATYIFADENFEIKPQDAIKNAFNSFNETYKEIKEGGTTATVLIFTKKSFMIANVGDSHAICSIAGKAHLLTENHHPSEQKERERIEELEKINNEYHKATWTRNYPNNPARSYIKDWKNNEASIRKKYITSVTRMQYGLILSRTLGDFVEHPYVIAEPFVQEIELSTNHEFIIMASDGLWDGISYQAAVDFVSEKIKEIKKDCSTITSQEAEKIAQELIKTTLAVHDTDNATATIIFLNHIKTN